MTDSGHQSRLVGHGRGGCCDSILADTDAGVLGALPIAPEGFALWTAAARSLRILLRTSASPAASTGSRLIASTSAFFSQSDAAGSSVIFRASRNQTLGSLSLGMDCYLKSVPIKRVDGSRPCARTMRRFQDSGYQAFRANSPTNEELDTMARACQGTRDCRRSAGPQRCGGDKDPLRHAKSSRTWKPFAAAPRRRHG
jgi:hypothetical protein